MDREKDLSLTREVGENGVNLDLRNHSVDYVCPNTECSMSNAIAHIDYINAPVVGVKEAPWTDAVGDAKMAAVCECPGCFEKYWFHIQSSDVEAFIKKVQSKK